MRGVSAMLKVNVLCAVVALMFSGVAHADDSSSGDYWLSVCQSSDPIEETQCLSYVLGVWDGLVVAGTAAKTKSDICSPKRVSARQLADIFVKYARASHEVRHMSGRVLIVASFMGAFPCRDGIGD